MLALLPVLVLFGLYTGAANAAITQSGTPPAAITFSGSSDLGGAILDPTLCPPRALDTANDPITGQPLPRTCEHVVFTAASTGTATISLTYDSLDQFGISVRVNDVAVKSTDCTGTNAVADPTTGMTTCTLTVDVIAGTTYDVTIVPETAMPGSPFNGTITFGSGGTGTGTGDGGGTPPPPLTPGGRLKGAGLVPSNNPSQLAKFVLRLGTGEDDEREHEGGVKYTNDHQCRFRSTSFAATVAGNDTGDRSTTRGVGDAHGSGRAQVGDSKDRDEGRRNEQSVTFTVHAEDNGEGSNHNDTMDVFRITVKDSNGVVIAACSGGGNLVKGSIRYEANDRHHDDDDD